jgi:hypothetical protein
MLDRDLVRKVVSSLIIAGAMAVVIWLVLALIPKISDTRRRTSPVVQQATKTAWKEIQQAEVRSFSAQAQNPSAFFQERAFFFTQVDSSDADPALQEYVRRTVETSKELAGIFKEIENEVQQTEASRQELAQWIEVFGQICGAMVKNDRSVSDNMQIGQFAGQLTGWATTGFLASVSDADIRRKYESRLQAAGKRFEQLAGWRPSLAKELSEKYNLQLLDAF